MWMSEGTGKVLMEKSYYSQFSERKVLHAALSLPGWWSSLFNISLLFMHKYYYFCKPHLLDVSHLHPFSVSVSVWLNLPLAVRLKNKFPAHYSHSSRSICRLSKVNIQLPATFARALVSSPVWAGQEGWATINYTWCSGNILRCSLSGTQKKGTEVLVGVGRVTIDKIYL